LPGGQSEWEPPDPLSNSEVKTLCADGSVPFGHARVGHCQALKWRRSPAGNIQWGFFRLEAVVGAAMNNIERRQLIKARVVDVSVAKTGINESRRRRSEAAKKLRKELAAANSRKQQAEVISYPRHAIG
jgi:hypothetical protein